MVVIVIIELLDYYQNPNVKRYYYAGFGIKTSGVLY